MRIIHTSAARTSGLGHDAQRTRSSKKDLLLRVSDAHRFPRAPTGPGRARSRSMDDKNALAGRMRKLPGGEPRVLTWAINQADFGSWASKISRSSPSILWAAFISQDIHIGSHAFAGPVSSPRLLRPANLCVSGITMHGSRRARPSATTALHARHSS